MLRGRNGFQLRRFLIDLAGTSLIAADDAWLAALAAQSGKAGLPARFVRQDQVPQALAADSGVRRILVLDSANEEAARAQLLRRLREERPAGATDSYQVATFVADLLPVVIARRSAGEVSFDPPPDISDTLLYSIVGTPRSGSTFLSDLLRSAGFGDPVEHLRAPLAAAFAARPPGLFDLARFTQRLIAAGRTGSVFGTKLLSGVGRGLEKSLTPPEAAFVRGLAARTTLIYLNRSDKVRQAISALRARKTGVWHSTDARYQGPEHYESIDYDFNEIARTVRQYVRKERRLAKLVSGHPRLIVVDYDQLTAAPERTCREIADKLGLPVRGTPAAQVAKLADEASEELARRFLHDAAQRGSRIELIVPTEHLLEAHRSSAR